MKDIFLLVFFIACNNCLLAQVPGKEFEKPPIDTSNLYKWLSVKTTVDDAKVAISNNGEYALYKIREHWRLPATLIIQAIHDNWKTELSGVENAVFTDNSKKAVFIKSKDSLSILTLGSSSIEYISHVSSFKLFNQGREEWIACQLTAPGKKLILRNLEKGKEHSFSDVSEYLLSPDKNNLVLKTEFRNDNVVMQSLHWVNLKDLSSKVIWSGGSSELGRNAFNLVVDDRSIQLAFCVEENASTISSGTDKKIKSIWYYKAGTDNAVQLVDDRSAGIEEGLEINAIAKFSNDANRLFFYLKEKDNSKPKPGAVKVDVWSYSDPQIQSQQLNELYSKNYLAVIHINNQKIIRLQKEDESLVFDIDGVSDSVVLTGIRKGEFTEWNWNKTAQDAFFLVNTSTGKRKEVSIGNPIIAVDGKYIIGIGRDFTDIYSYEIANGTSRNITALLPIPIGGFEYDEPYIIRSRGLWADGTTDNKEAIIVYDEFDIWKIDPSGKKSAVNLTNGFGRKNKIEFRLAAMYSGNAFTSGKTIPDTGRLMLHAFDKSNKKSGFYEIVLGRKEDPRLLSMGAYVYGPGYIGRTQIKARDAEAFIVMRESTAESPNYFWTKDFKMFTQLSSVYPERNYNWLTSELISFNTLDNRIEQTVIYKPENFDLKKKYPVIIHYYDRKTQNLNKYHPPAEPNGELDIAWFVSHGYVVVTPDIHFKIGDFCQSVINSVMGVAKYISKYTWVDARHIGIQGHSLGGYETNCIVSHTNFFAAAISSSGMSDIVSNYLELLGDHTNHDWYENRVTRIGATLWERPDVYVSNSPILYANKVTTPILTIANKRDGSVQFAQGVEWFLALRRLGKKAWMLQYDQGGHGLSGKEYKDYVLRSTQFFDHYLKGAPAPKWMTRGIPAKMKGIDDGLQLDYEIKTPGEGLLTPDQKKKFEALNNKSR